MRPTPLLSIATAAVMIAACSSQVPDLDTTTAEPTTTQVEGAGGSTTSVVAPTTEAIIVVPESLNGLETTSISIVDGDITYVLTVAVADTPDKRAQGLMNVADLADLDGMIFVWPEATTTAFWMKDTILALDIAFFDEQFALVDHFTMAPCPAEPCASYPAAGAFLYAVEVPESGFAALSAAARLVLAP